MIQVTILSN